MYDFQTAEQLISKHQYRLQIEPSATIVEQVLQAFTE
jgi:hypothetical protein